MVSGTEYSIFEILKESLNQKIFIENFQSFFSKVFKIFFEIFRKIFLTEKFLIKKIFFRYTITTKIQKQIFLKFFGKR